MSRLLGNFSEIKTSEEDQNKIIKYIKRSTDAVEREIKFHKKCLNEGSEWIISIIESDNNKIVMPRCEIDLREQYRGRGVSNVGDLCSILSGVLKGINHIHQSGIIHRDIKPENILLSKPNHPLICDFGSAVEIGKTEVFPSLCNCTLKYSSIELLFGKKDYNPSVDYWSVGMTMGFLILGKDVIDAAQDSEIGVAMAARDVVGWSADADWSKDLPFGFLARKPSDSNYPKLGNWNGYCESLFRGLLSPDSTTRLDCKSALPLIEFIGFVEP